mmetsp:Transcript_158883/g.509509  ORF Transcript_158883/g.509509 Transcript_158883/m.509509 type:complete len:266 (-) Transcript_158883:2626-3423(-)
MQQEQLQRHPENARCREAPCCPVSRRLVSMASLAAAERAATFRETCQIRLRSSSTSRSSARRPLDLPKSISSHFRDGRRANASGRPRRCPQSLPACLRLQTRPRPAAAAPRRATGRHRDPGARSRWGPGAGPGRGAARRPAPVRRQCRRRNRRRCLHGRLGRQGQRGGALGYPPGCRSSPRCGGGPERRLRGGLALHLVQKACEQASDRHCLRQQVRFQMPSCREEHQMHAHSRLQMCRMPRCHRDHNRMTSCQHDRLLRQGARP